MHPSVTVLLVNDDARAVTGQYEEAGKVEVFKTMDPNVKPDDLVVVESSTRHKMTVVKIKDVDVDIDFNAGNEIKWVVQRIDVDSHNVLVAQEGDLLAEVQAAERKRKKEELRESLMAHHKDKIQALPIHNVEDDAVTE